MGKLVGDPNKFAKKNPKVKYLVNMASRIDTIIMKGLADKMSPEDLALVTAQRFTAYVELIKDQQLKHITITTALDLITKKITL